MKAVLRGMWAGLVATGPMTLAMFAMHRWLPEGERHPLPPAELTQDIVDKVGLSKWMSHDSRSSAMMISHFGYGAVCGIAYALLGDRLKTRSLMKGAAFSFGIWALSYLGWIPTTGLRPGAHKTSRSRNLLMILAHFVWGASLSFTEDELKKRSRQLADGRQGLRHHQYGEASKYIPAYM